jgi:hypothetical protein
MYGDAYDNPNVTFNMSVPFLIEMDCIYRPTGAEAQKKKRAEEARQAKQRMKELYAQYRSRRAA